MKKITLSLIIVLNIFLANASQKITINGLITNNSEYTKVSLENILAGTTVATSEIKDGKYYFETEIGISDYYKISFSKEKYVLYIPEPGEKAVINIDINNLKNPEIKNSKQTLLYYSTSIKFTELEGETAKNELIINTINENPNSLVSLLFIESLEMSENMDLYKKLSEGLSEYKENTYVSAFQDQVKNESNLAIGNQAPEIELENPEGQVVKLSSLKGNYVLIDFWAAWCRPCRMESPNMIKMYDKFNPKGFEIYSVSLDQTKDAWLKAISDDKLGRWTHVSDLKYWNSAAGKAYNVHGIPYTVLLDKEGKIIAKGLRGDDLEKKLTEIFSE
jgi:peroxiredoxin